MKKCPECGYELDPNDEFCINCGVSLVNPDGSEHVKTVNRREKKHFPWGALIAVIFVLIVLVAGVAYYMQTPKVVLARSLEATFGDTLKGAPVSVSADLSPYIKDLPFIGGVDASAEAKFQLDTNNETLVTSLDATISGAKAICVDAYVKKDSITVASNELLGDKAYCVEIPEEFKEFMPKDNLDIKKFIEYAQVDRADDVIFYDIDALAAEKMGLTVPDDFKLGLRFHLTEDNKIGSIDIKTADPGVKTFWDVEGKKLDIESEYFTQSFTVELGEPCEIPKAPVPDETFTVYELSNAIKANVGNLIENFGIQLGDTLVDTYWPDNQLIQSSMEMIAGELAHPRTQKEIELDNKIAELEAERLELEAMKEELAVAIEEAQKAAEEARAAASRGGSSTTGRNLAVPSDTSSCEQAGIYSMSMLGTTAMLTIKDETNYTIKVTGLYNLEESGTYEYNEQNKTLKFNNSLGLDIVANYNGNSISASIPGLPAITLTKR